MKTNFDVNLTGSHTKSTRFHTKVWCELNPYFFLMRGRKKRAADRLITGPEMRYRLEAARLGRKRAGVVGAVGAETEGS